MAKPAYSLAYAILIALGLLALVLFNRMIASDDAAPAAQASLQRNEATAREARDAAVEGAEKAGSGERAEPVEPAAERADGQSAKTPAAQAEAPTAAGAREEEERK